MLPADKPRLNDEAARGQNSAGNKCNGARKVTHLSVVILAASGNHICGPKPLPGAHFDLLMKSFRRATS